MEICTGNFGEKTFYKILDNVIVLDKKIKKYPHSKCSSISVGEILRIYTGGYGCVENIGTSERFWDLL